MAFNKIELNLDRTLNLPTCATTFPKKDNIDEELGDSLGGALRNGQLVWVANGPHLDVFCTKSSNRVSSYTFEHHLNTIPSLITCVTEIQIPDLSSPMLAVGVQFQMMGGMICIFSVQGSRVLRSIEILDKITCCSFVPQWIMHKTGVKFFDGCLIYGSDMGTVYLIDLCFKKCSEVMYNKERLKYEIDLNSILNVVADVDPHELKTHMKRARKGNLHLSVQLQVLQDSGPVLSMIIIPQQMTLVVGLHDGRMILYDLCDLQAFHLAYPPEMESPLLKLCYIEPADDPRACIYVWALHSSPRSAVCVMHSIMFEHKRIAGENGEMLYENFQSCSARLTISFNQPGSRPVSCQSITKTINRADEEEEITCVCAIAWETVVAPNSTNLLVFDLNQWYKEQMPEVIDLSSPCNCVAEYSLVPRRSLEIWIDQSSLTTFDSVQRPEEHFYPIAHAFNCHVLTENLIDFLIWPGLQNRALDYLNTHGAMAVFDPNHAYAILTAATLHPQFNDDGCYNMRQMKSIAAKRDHILSIALEYRCVRLLKECSQQWGDGSHLGRGGGDEDEGVALSTLTDWIWKRAQLINNCVNAMCIPLFDHSQRQIDFRTKKQLLHCSRQLKLLAHLLETTINTNKATIPETVANRLKIQANSLRISYEYQEILQWLVNTGILPEGQLTPYPHHILREFYQQQRATLNELAIKSTVNGSSSNQRFSCCRYLYIDQLIENECGGKEMRDQWKGTEGLFPPVSLQEMLRLLLIPKITNEIKYSILLYLFLDLSVALEDDQRFEDVLENLIKFPSVFKLSPAVIKRTQAFWKLDHGQFENALDELFSPLARGGNQLKFWQYEFLIETLLIQKKSRLALRALRSNSLHHCPFLEIKTLLANQCLSEAFQVQRSLGDSRLLRLFFENVFQRNRYDFLLEFGLTEIEESVLCDYLNEINSNESENFHIIYLLQRSKYVEAVQLIERIQSRNRSRLPDSDNVKLVLSAYNLTLPPVVKEISKSYFKYRPTTGSSSVGNVEGMDVDDDASPSVPFSTHLIQTKIRTPAELYQLTFNCIDRSNARPSIPFIEKMKYGTPMMPNSPKTMNGERCSVVDLIVPKVIRKNEIGGKRKIHHKDTLLSSEKNGDNEVEDVRPRKKIHLDHEYKKNLLTQFKERKGFNFSQFYEMNLLSTPIVRPATPPSTLNDGASMLESSRSHGILKNTCDSPVPGAASGVETPRKRAESIEKSIKFNVDVRALNFTQTSTSKRREPFVFGGERIDEETVPIETSTVKRPSGESNTPEAQRNIIEEILEEKVTPEMWNAVPDDARRLSKSSPNSVTVHGDVHETKSVETAVTEQQPEKVVKSRRSIRSRSKTPDHFTTLTRKSNRLHEKSTDLPVITKEILQTPISEDIPEVVPEEIIETDVKKLIEEVPYVSVPLVIPPIVIEEVATISPPIETPIPPNIIIEEVHLSRESLIIEPMTVTPLSDEDQVKPAIIIEEVETIVLTSIENNETSQIQQPVVIVEEVDDPNHETESDEDVEHPRIFTDMETTRGNISVLQKSPEISSSDEGVQNTPGTQNAEVRRIFPNTSPNTDGLMKTSFETVVDNEEDDVQDLSYCRKRLFEDSYVEDEEMDEEDNEEDENQRKTTDDDDNEMEIDFDDDIEEVEEDDADEEEDFEDIDDELGDEEDVDIDVEDMDDDDVDDVDDDDDDDDQSQSSSGSTEPEVIDILSSSEDDEDNQSVEKSGHFEVVDRIETPSVASVTVDSTTVEPSLPPPQSNPGDDSQNSNGAGVGTTTDVNVSAMVYDDIYFEMSHTNEEDQDNLNNALMVDYNYSPAAEESASREIQDVAEKIRAEDEIVKVEENTSIVIKGPSTLDNECTDDKPHVLIETPTAPPTITITESPTADENLNNAVIMENDESKNFSQSPDSPEMKLTIEESLSGEENLNQALIEKPSFDKSIVDSPEKKIEKVSSTENIQSELPVKNKIDERFSNVELTPTKEDSENIIIGSYSLRKTRARSASIESEMPQKRKLRGTSIPHESKSTVINNPDELVKPLQRTRRSMSMSDTNTTPFKSLKGKIDLEMIEENTVLTPIRVTTRRNSVSELSRTVGTPRRRSSFTNSKENLANSVENLMVTPTRPGRRSVSIDLESNSSKVSQGSGQKRMSLRLSAKKQSDDVNEPLPTTSKQTELIFTPESRRLTRHQLSMLEKNSPQDSKPIKENLSTPSPPKKIRKSPRQLKSHGSTDDLTLVSDTDSVASDMSFRSRSSAISRSSRISRNKVAKSKNSEQAEDANLQLPSIEEDEDSVAGNETEEPMKRKGRPRKASTNK